MSDHLFLFARGYLPPLGNYVLTKCVYIRERDESQLRLAGVLILSPLRLLVGVLTQRTILWMLQWKQIQVKVLVPQFMLLQSRMLLLFPFAFYSTQKHQDIETIHRYAPGLHQSNLCH